MSLAAMFLAMADKGEVDLAERLKWTEADLLSNSDFTREHIAGGLTIEELAHTTLVTSDNTAANLLLKKAGGPFKLTEFWRSLGDKVSRLDRSELELNEVPAGTELDTTTPAAMASTVAKLVHGDGLEPHSREKLRAWMAEVETGKRRATNGTAVIAILHDLNLAARFANRIVVLHRGRVVASGSPRETITNTMLRNVFEVDKTST